MTDKVTRQCPQTTTFLKRKERPKRYRTEVLPLTDLTSYRYAKPAHNMRMYFWWSVCTFYVLACQVRVTVEIQVFVVLA